MHVNLGVKIKQLKFESKNRKSCETLSRNI
jgi:hypothetical protein